ncbi:MAG: hypothetical protein HW416_1847 [Chloroflexi bacterium]|nr:hypothetical protein [Chloroflexota bacterium]
MASGSSSDARDVDRRYDELYEAYGKPLEAAHAGEYLAISATGQTILGTTLREVARKARTAFGAGNFLYKVGDEAAGKWR